MSGNLRRSAAPRAELDPGEVVRRDALSHRLLGAVARGLRRGGDDPRNGDRLRRDARTGWGGRLDRGTRPPGGGGLLEPDCAAQIDADAVAAWVVSHFEDMPADRYAGAVIGSPHASAVHLALTLGVPWLPATFDVAVRAAVSAADEPEEMIEQGRRVATAVAAANPNVTVRQIHDPVHHRGDADPSVLLRVGWLRLPRAYRDFLTRRLDADAPVIAVRDVGRWLVVHSGDRCSFQLGSRGGGLDALDYYQGGDRLSMALRATGHRMERVLDLVNGLHGYEDGEGEYAMEPAFVDDLRWSTKADGRRLRQLLYRRPEVLSGAVADLYRRWLRSAGRTGNRLVVECGHLFEPWQVLRAGLVPYWCEHPLVEDVAALEWWLAGSGTFNSIDVLAEPPGMSLPDTAYLAQWASAAAFASRRGVVDPRCARSYPLGGLPAGHANSVLAQHPYDLPYLPTLAPDATLDEMASVGETSGLLVL